MCTRLKWVRFFLISLFCQFFGWACMAVATNLDLRLVVYVALVDFLRVLRFVHPTFGRSEHSKSYTLVRSTYGILLLH